MKQKNIFTKILAIAGTALVWFPILAPVLLSLILIFRSQIFRLDYLMPAELFPAALIGGALLLWGALRAHAHRELIGWGLGTMVFMLVGGQALAVYTGLASGAAEPVGWRLWLVAISLVIYTLAMIATGVGGALLLHDLFKPDPLP